MSQRKSVSATGEKRKRDPTFAASEKLALIELVQKHYEIVESKKTDAVSIKNKNDEWLKIELEYNAISNIYPRGWNILKNCWENLKKRAKQEQTQRNQHHLVTGGPPKKFNEDPAIERVLALIQTRESGYIGYINVYDSDSTSLATGSFGLPRENSQSPSLLLNDFCGVRNPALREANLNDVEQHVEEKQRPHTQGGVITPRIQNCAPAVAARSYRRPTLRRDREAQNLTISRITTLELANTHAQEEHDLKIKILRLQEEQESIKVKQEILKLQILEEQLKKLKE